MALTTPPNFNTSNLIDNQDFRPILIATGPSPPSDLVAFHARGPVPFGVDPCETRSFNYDEGHAGRFTVFGTGGASLNPSFLDDDPMPLNYIMDNLVYGEPATYGTNEVIVFAPGLNTLHEPSGRNRTSVMRIAHYFNVLGLPMAQVHTGTQFDQGPSTVNSSAELTSFLAWNGLLSPAEVVRAEEDGEITIKPFDKDKIQTYLSASDFMDIPLKETIRKLLDAAAKSIWSNYWDEPHLVLMMYSRASVEVASALREWKEERSRYLSDELIEAALRQAVTIVTIGTASRDYPDGPAYIHISMNQDKLTAQAGVSATLNEGGGADAVYLHGDSPYNNTGNDSHNFGAVTSQFLAVIMRVNQLETIREVYDKAQLGLLVTPENIYNLTLAMVKATKGMEWVWFPENSFEGMPPLPGEEEARAILDTEFGDGTYDEIAARNVGGMEGIIDQFLSIDFSVEGGLCDDYEWSHHPADENTDFGDNADGSNENDMDGETSNEADEDNGSDENAGREQNNFGVAGGTKTSTGNGRPSLFVTILVTFVASIQFLVQRL